jgi:O-phosphoseryl-tRNA(Cys) synthetase
MTRKDYIVIADILASVQNHYFKGKIDADDVVKHIAKAFCEDAKLDNPNFDQDRFLSRATVTL